MENDLSLKQPSDRRMALNALPPGPPGAELDTVAFDTQKVLKDTGKETQRDGVSSKSSRRRSPSGSPPPSTKRKSQTRGRRTPSPAARRRRSPSPRGGRGRFRDYSPERRRFDGRSRRSPDRRRSPIRDRDRRNGGRGDRGYRGRSRSRTRSPVSPRRTNSGNRWSPKKKPNSPPAPPQLSQPPPTAQYAVMQPNMYGDAYSYNQAFVQPPPQAFVQPDFTIAPPPIAQPAPGFAYQTAPPWGVAENYAQQNWMPQNMPDAGTMQMQQPPTQMQPQQAIIPAAVVPAVANQLIAIPDAAPGTVDANPAHDAVAQEAENQRDELKKQRSSYLKKTSVLKKELKMLKEQRKDLNSGEAPASPTTKGFIDENEKLQGQIQKKLSTIENVIDMLTGIIGEENLEKENDTNSNSPKNITHSDGQGRKKKFSKPATTSESSSDSSSSTSSSSSSSSSENEEDDSSPERLKNKAIESMKSKQKEANKKEILVERKAKEELKKMDEQNKFNFVFYDPEMHWCKTCDLFPKTAKDYLNHLHSKEHLERERVETPWHAIMVNDQYPTFPNAPTKRTPIRGLTFFVPATAWYCKLCNAWMGDLHCASSHLKSQQHSNKYNSYLEKNPHFEVDWLADRQRTLNAKRSLPPPQQITSVSTTGSENVSSKKSKKDDEKSKKRKKKSSDKKKKKKRSKKRKKAAASSSSSSSEDSTSESEDTKYSASKELNNSNPAASIRVAMRKQTSKIDENVPPPAPSMKLIEEPPQANVSGPIGKWTVTQVGNKPTPSEEESKRDDAIISQWNTVQPVISESEKKLLEQLKGKLKNKPRDEPQTAKTTSSARGAAGTVDKEKERSSSRRDERDRDIESEGRRRSRSPRGGRAGGGRSRSRSRSRGRGRGGFRGRLGRRSRSRSRGRFSPGGWRDGGRRRRSRSRSLRRRSRSYDRRRRSSRSRSRSGSNNRIEKPIVRYSEFRPRVPEKDKEKEKKQADAKDKKEAAKKATAKPKTVVETGKKLPFIGKMPVFKKQSAGGEGGELKEGMETYDDANAAHMAMAHASAVRPLAPTAAQIQMAMMEDVYGNAPPFHPDAAMMMDYDDLMPDPVQFVNLMGQAPPPPPPPAPDAEDDKDMLPPGIDETESEEFVPKPISDAPIPRKGPLPKDFEEALNIIFPGDKKPGDEDEKKGKAASGETQIIVDEPVMQAADLVREGIHLVTIEETSAIGIDDASQLSMNEPLVFNNRGAKSGPPPEDSSSQNALDIDLSSIEPPPPPPVTSTDTKKTSTAKVEAIATETKAVAKQEEAVPEAVPEILTPLDIPIPDSIEDATSAVVYDLDDIPQPPPSPTESEKNRRQEELDDLAMLGIDASDMAAQCM